MNAILVLNKILKCFIWSGFLLPMICTTFIFVRFCMLNNIRNLIPEIWLIRKSLKTVAKTRLLMQMVDILTEKKKTLKLSDIWDALNFDVDVLLELKFALILLYFPSLRNTKIMMRQNHKSLLEKCLQKLTEKLKILTNRFVNFLMKRQKSPRLVGR